MMAVDFEMILIFFYLILMIMVTIISYIRGRAIQGFGIALIISLIVGLIWFMSHAEG